MSNKFKKYLDIINFKMVSIFLAIIMFCSLVIQNFFNYNVGLWITLIVLILFSIEFGLYVIKYMYKDAHKIVIALFIAIYFICLVISFGKLMKWVVPVYFPDDQQVMYNLFASSFSAFITAIIGFVAVYFGAEYGGKKARDNMMIQIEIEREKQEKIEQKNKEILTHTIIKFLKEEIEFNSKVMQDVKLYEYLSKENRVQYGYNFHTRLKFDDYNNIKYELIKYYELSIVQEVVDIYSLFYLLGRYSDLNQFSHEEYNRISRLEEKLNKFRKI